MSNQSPKRNTGKPAQSNGMGRKAAAPSSRAGNKALVSKAAKTTTAAKTSPIPDRKPLINARAKNDLVGLIVAIIAIVLLVMLFLPSKAIGAKAVSEGLRFIGGQGAALLPFMLLAWSATFFIKRRLTNSSPRLALGLAVIYLALISILAVMIPGAAEHPGRVLDPAWLSGGGGYIGGAVAWALLSFTGQVATMIILVGLILIGLVLIGLSITGLVELVIRSIKSWRKHNDGIPLPGTLQSMANGGASATSPSSGSAYQMGPVGAHIPTHARGTFSSDEKNAMPLYTDIMDAAQLEYTQYRPRRGSWAGEAAAVPAGLGSTRRRLTREGSGERSDPEARTMLLHRDNRAKGMEVPGAEGNSEALTATDREGVPEKKKGRKAPNRSSGEGHFTSLHRTYTLPSMKLLRVSKDKAHTKAGALELRSTANRLQATLEEFRVDGEVVGWIAGPTVTLYKISLGEGVRLNRITALQSDIQLALAAQAIRIVAPIPGTSLVGIEIPNAVRNEVLLGDVLDSARDTTLALAIGKDVEGESIVADLASMPHLLIGGTTGSGKSVAINSIIMSLLMRTTPEEVRMILIDPKRVELTLYNGIPHLYVPVVTDAGQAASALAWCVAEMDRRLKLFEKHTVKNIRQFNSRVQEQLEKLEKARTFAAELSEAAGRDNYSSTGDAPELDAAAAAAADTALLVEDEEEDITTEQENLKATLPYLVIVIDELADLMMLNGKEVESAVSRLAQLARAAGLHLIVATQRPSTNVITGLIKANIVNRIAFTVASGIDSRVILDTPGAEDLIGLGDMLFSRPEYSKPARIQGCLVSEPEIETIVEYWRSLGVCDYHEEILLAACGGGHSSGSFGDDSLDDDPLLWEAAEIVVSTQLGSTSTLQRRLKVGYARAGRIMDMLEMKGIVGPPNGSKPREVLVDDVLDLETLRAFG